MPIDFFAPLCNNPRGNCQNEPIHCLQNISNNTFGISDVKGGDSVPACINAINPDPSTDFIVINNSNTQVTFKAIDWCVKIYRTGTYSLDDVNRTVTQFSSDSVLTPASQLIKRCEGFLQFNNTITFIEIKNRHCARGGWLNDAREKFEETILSFKEHHPALANQIVKPILSNPSFPGPHTNEMIEKKILKDKIGVEFIRQDRINI
jgi:hypothetical protein